MNKYSTSWFSIIVGFIGILLIWRVTIYFCFESPPFTIFDIILFLITLMFSWGIYWLIEKRLRKKYLYCDWDGVVINFKGLKVYWNEIESVHSYTYYDEYFVVRIKDEYRGIVSKRSGSKKDIQYFFIIGSIIGNAGKFNDEIKNFLKNNNY